MADAMTPRDGRGRGFTLLEVLLAFVIAVPALLTLSWVAGDALHALRATARTEEALARSRSRLTLALHAAPLVPGESHGDDGGGFRWRVRVSPVEGPAIQPLGSRGPRRLQRVETILYAVSVQLEWHEGDATGQPPRSLRLDTLKLVSRLLPRVGLGEAGR